MSAVTGGYRLVFDGQVDATAVGTWLWPDGVPAGVQLSSAASTEVHLGGLNREAYESMRSDVAGMIAEAGVITAEPYEPPAGGTGTGTDAPSGVNVEMDKDAQRELEEKIKHWLEGAHEIGAVTEVTASLVQAGAHLSHGTAAAGAVESAAVAAEFAAGVLGTVGSVAFIAWVGFEVVDTFRGEKRREETQGYVYGLMWEALGEPDHLPAFAPGITYSAEEHEEAFRSGVRKGRDKASEVKVKNHIMVSVGVLAARTGFGETWAAQQVLSEIWRQNRERAPGEGDDDLLNWPKPWDRTILGW